MNKRNLIFLFFCALYSLTGFSQVGRGAPGGGGGGPTGPIGCIEYNANPTPLEVCDDNEDGFAVFDLASKIEEIKGDPAPVGHTISFHINYSDADNNVNPLDMLYTNEQINNQTIYARVEIHYDLSTSCHRVVSLDLIVKDCSMQIDKTIPSNLKLYPNPASNKVTIMVQEFDTASLILEDIQGKKVLNTTLQFTSDNASIDVSQLQKGLYFVIIQSSDKRFVQKLVIE